MCVCDKSERMRTAVSCDCNGLTRQPRKCVKSTHSGIVQRRQERGGRGWYKARFDRERQEGAGADILGFLQATATRFALDVGRGDVIVAVGASAAVLVLFTLGGVDVHRLAKAVVDVVVLL